MNPTKTFETLLCEAPEPSLLLVRFNRPNVANALNTQMIGYGTLIASFTKTGQCHVSCRK